jgi:hypothetical protein
VSQYRLILVGHCAEADGAEGERRALEGREALGIGERGLHLDRHGAAGLHFWSSGWRDVTAGGWIEMFSTASR